jgi:hypothetical protein
MACQQLSAKNRINGASKAVQKYRKKPKLVGNLNELNAPFQYKHYRKSPSGGEVNIQLTCLHERWQEEEFGVGSGCEQTFAFRAILNN